MYLTKDATAATLRQIAGLAPGSTLAMTSGDGISVSDAAGPRRPYGRHAPAPFGP